MGLFGWWPTLALPKNWSRPRYLASVWSGTIFGSPSSTWARPRTVFANSRAKQRRGNQPPKYWLPNLARASHRDIKGTIDFSPPVRHFPHLSSYLHAQKRSRSNHRAAAFCVGASFSGGRRPATLLHLSPSSPSQATLQGQPLKSPSNTTPIPFSMVWFVSSNPHHPLMDVCIVRRYYLLDLRIACWILFPVCWK